MPNYETVTPAFKVGDRVALIERSGMVGTITKIYPASGVPLWYGQRRIVHTHCYQIKTQYGDMWGLVDALLIPVE
jgi:hypothetical protein